jgi:hypothetical protein
MNWLYDTVIYSDDKTVIDNIYNKVTLNTFRYNILKLKLTYPEARSVIDTVMNEIDRITTTTNNDTILTVNRSIMIRNGTYLLKIYISISTYYNNTIGHSNHNNHNNNHSHNHNYFCDCKLTVSERYLSLTERCVGYLTSLA